MKKNICFLTTSYDFPRQRMISYYEKIIPPGVKIYLLCLDKEKSKFNVKRAVKIGYRNKKNLFFQFLRNFCKQKKIDILTNLSGGPNVAFTMALSALGIKTKVIYYDHGNPKFKGLLFLSTFQFLLNRILIATSDLKSKMSKYLFMAKGKIDVLPTAIDTNFFKPKNRDTCRRSLGFKKNDFIIISPGRIQHMKGSDLLFKIALSNPDKKFILMGALMDDNFKRRKPKNVIIKLVKPNKVVDYYNSSDLCLFLSRREGLGLAYREAMSCGIPSIISDIEALRTIEAAIKVPLEITEIQKALNNFFKTSKKEKKAISVKTRKYILNQFSEEVLKDLHLKYLFNSL